MAFTRAWDEVFPPDTQNANLLGQDVRQFKQDIRERLAAFGAGVIASRETPEAAFGDANKGVLYYATDENKLYRWNGSAWILVKDIGALATISVGGAILDPAGARDVVTWRAPYACTVTNVRGYRVGGTGTTINARRNGVDEHLAGDLSLGSADAWADGGAVQNTAYVAGDKLEIRLKSITGAVTQVNVQVDLTR